MIENSIVYRDFKGKYDYISLSKAEGSLICRAGIRTNLKRVRYSPAGEYRSERRTTCRGQVGRKFWTTNERACLPAGRRRRASEAEIPPLRSTGRSGAICSFRLLFMGVFVSYNLKLFIFYDLQNYSILIEL